MKDKVQNICSRYTPKQIAIAISSLIFVFGCTFITIIVVSLYEIGKDRGKDTLRIEHIDSIPVVPENLITEKTKENGRG